MIETQTILKQRIIECLNTSYGITVATLTCLHVGADIDASVYKAETHDKSSYFVKLKRGRHHDIGPLIQLLLHDAGIQQIICPIQTNQGNPTHAIDEFTLIVYPFIEGHDGFSRDLTNDQWITLGNALRHVHEFQLSAHIKNQIAQESYSPKWRETVRLIYAYIDTKQTVTDEIAIQLLTYMQAQRETIERLVNRAQHLADKIQKQSSEFVLCHADMHGGNVLLANDDTLYIVDWDQPIMAPKERDLMFIGGGVANVWNNPHQEEYFYKGYGNTEVNREILAYYRHERIVEDIAEYSQQLLLTTKGGYQRAVMYTQFMDMFTPRGVVDIAFETDRDYNNYGF
jgi:spectinomycin phosphotransferase